MPHREVPVQVTAWVDEGVAELVTALNAVPGLMTLSSCQEGDDGLARVWFCTHHEGALYETVSSIARVIGGGLREHVTLSFWWGSDDAPAVADLACPPERLSAVAASVRASADRRTPSPGGTECREPRS